MTPRARAPLLLLILLGLSGCTFFASYLPHRRLDDRERLDNFLEEVFLARLDRDPVLASRLGVARHQGRWTDASDAFAVESHELLLRDRARLLGSRGDGQGEFDYGKLERSARLSFRWFTRDTERRLLAFQWRLHEYPLDQDHGLHIEIPATLIELQRVEDEDDLSAYVQRLQGVGPLLRQLSAALELRRATGVVLPRFAYPRVIADCRDLISGAPFEEGAGDGLLLADFRSRLDTLDLDEDARQAWLRRATEALRRSVRSGYETLIVTLQSHEQEALDGHGAWKLPDGRAYYAAALRRATTTDLSADEVHRLGQREVRRIHDEMGTIADQVDFPGSLREFFALVRTSARFYHPNDDEGRAAYLAEAERLAGAMGTRLAEVLAAREVAALVVRRMEPFRERSALGAAYVQPSFWGDRPGVLLLDLRAMHLVPRYEMEALVYHYGVPGRHLQTAIAEGLEWLPRLRRFGRIEAYELGWALYAERLAKDLGAYEDPYADFGRLARELRNACLLVVDTGVHDRGWTREQAIDYLVETTPDSRGRSVEAVQAVIVAPARATAPTVALRTILRLRAEAQARLGEGFGLREFHERILECGPVPLDLLEDVVDEWLAAAP